MSTTVNANVTVAITGLMTGSAVLGNQPQYPFNFTPLISAVLAAGTGAALKINQAVTYQGTLATNSNATLNLNTLGTTDNVGGTVNMLQVKLFYILHQGVTIGAPLETDTLTVEPGASNGFTTYLGASSTLILPGGSSNLSVSPGAVGWAINASTGMNLKLVSGASNSGTTNYQIILLGSTS